MAMAVAALPRGRLLLAIALTMAVIGTANAQTGASCSSPIIVGSGNQTIQGTTISRVMSGVLPCSNVVSYVTWYRVNVVTTGAYGISVNSSVNATWSLFWSASSTCSNLTCLTTGAVADDGLLQTGFAYVAVSTGNRTANYSLQISGSVCATVIQSLQEYLESTMASFPACKPPSFQLDASHGGCPATSCLTASGVNCTDPCPCLSALYSSLEADNFAPDFALGKQLCPELASTFGTCPMGTYQQYPAQCGLSQRFNALISNISAPGGSALSVCQSFFVA
eukprot:jgi/Mesvir1/12539/Mv21634-RA.1